MPVLDAKALETDPEGCALLREAIRPRRGERRLPLGVRDPAPSRRPSALASLTMPNEDAEPIAIPATQA